VIDGACYMIENYQYLKRMDNTLITQQAPIHQYRYCFI